MAITDIDEEKAVKLADRLAQIVANDDGQTMGPRVLQAITENHPNAGTVTGALLAYQGSDYASEATRKTVRMLLLAYRDQLLIDEQVESQRTLAKSTDKLNTRVLVATWIGAVIGGVGVLVGIFAIFKGN